MATKEKEAGQSWTKHEHLHDEGNSGRLQNDFRACLWFVLIAERGNDVKPKNSRIYGANAKDRATNEEQSFTSSRSGRR
jgi:hypothetical protein